MRNPDFFIDLVLRDSYNPASPTRLLQEALMRAKFVCVMVLTFFSTILATVSGCDDSLDFNNTPPSGLAITRDKCYLGPNDAVTLTGQATDNDGDEISYSWTAETGTLTPADGQGQVVIWRAPDSHGTYRVVLKVTDELDYTSKGIDLDVGRNLDDLHGDAVILDQTDYAYVVPNDGLLNISGLSTVTIEAGVTVVFNEGTGGFGVAGTLVINGTAQDRVLLMPNKCPGEDRPWKGITFSGAQAVGNLNYVTITSSADGLDVEDGAIVTADNIIVDQTTGDGVSVNSGANLTLSNSKIWENGGGIYVENGILLLQGSTIRYNGNYGFSMIENIGPFDVAVDSCVVANNDQYGFVMAMEANPVINNCSIFLNGPDGVAGRTLMLSTGYTNTDPIDMTGNCWRVTTAPEIESQINKNGAAVTVDFSGWLEEPPVKD